MLNQNHYRILILFVALALISAGCAGNPKVLFVTRSNIGIDIDSTPPTSELSIARREGVITPSMEGQTPPVLASFSVSNRFSQFFFGVSQTFAGGDAAVIMSTLLGGPTDTNQLATETLNPIYESGIALRSSTNITRAKRTHEVAPTDRSRFFFGTDTAFGLKVAYSGTAGAVPDSLKLGFNRKEYALAPISRVRTGSHEMIKIPSFVASVGTSAEVAGVTGQTRHSQYFATGKAAQRLALHQEIRQQLLDRVDPSLRKTNAPSPLDTNAPAPLAPVR